MARSIKSPKSVSTSREIQTVILIALFGTAWVLDMGKHLRWNQHGSAVDFPQVRDHIGPCTVKIFRTSRKDGDDLLPLCTGFIVKSERQVQDQEVFVVTRLSSVEKHELEICYYPYSQEDNALGPSNMAPAEIVFRDEVRDLALLKGKVSDRSSLCRPVRFGFSDFNEGGLVLCNGFCRAINWSGNRYAKPTVLVSSMKKVIDKEAASAMGLTGTELIEISDYAPIDRNGILSGSPVIDTDGRTIGMWIDRAPYSRFFLPAGEIVEFLITSGAVDVVAESDNATRSD